MTDETLIDHERRLTRLEMGWPAALARLEALEQAEHQRSVDKEQAERREMAKLRSEATEALAGIAAMKAQLDGREG